MTTIAHVEVDPPTAGAYLARWQQPYIPGTDDVQQWFVTTSAGTKQVQRNPYTDDVMYCSAEVAAGTTAVNVFTGADTSPATGWVTPTLTGMLVRWIGTDDSIHVADLTSSAQQQTLRTGHNEQSIRRWVNALVTNAGSGNLSIGNAVAGHHAIMTFRADWPDVVEIVLSLSNASSTIATQGNGLKKTYASGGFFGTFGFKSCTFVPPTGWGYVTDRPLVAVGDTLPTINDYVSDGHAMPVKALTSRRFVIYKVATSGAAQMAQDLLEFKGLGRATSAGLRSYHSVRSFGPTKSLIPDLEEGYAGGYAQAKLVAQNAFDNISSAAAAGVLRGDFTTPRYGLFHAMGIQANPAGTGGDDIQPFQGFLQVREWVRYCALYASCKLDGSAVFLFNRTTGRPIRTRDFGDAYTNPGSIGGIEPDPQYLGRQPFPFYTQNDSGYDYRGARLRYFEGWIQPEWPPHYFDSNQNKYLPVDQALWGTAPRSILDFRCYYRPILEQKGHQVAVDGAGHPIFNPQIGRPYFEYAPLGGDPFGGYTIKDPEDAQHAIRMFAKLLPLAWLSGDLWAIDMLDSLAEFFALHYSEIGHVPVLYPESGNQHDVNSAPNTISLLSMLARQQEVPQTARIGALRSEGWVGYLFAAQYALTSEAAREDGYSTNRGIKKRAEMFFDFLRLGVLPNGATYKMTAGEAQNNGQLANAFGIPNAVYGLNPPPIQTNRRMMQVGLEMPITIGALFSLGKQLGRTDGEIHVLNAFRSHTGLVTLFTNYAAGDVSAFGPMKYAEVWSDAGGAPGVPTPGQAAQRYGTGAGNPGFPNHEWMVEMAYRVGGAATVLAVSNHLGHHAVGYPNQTAAQRGAQLLADPSYRGEWNLGLIPLLLHSPGPDVPVVPVSTVPSITGTVSTNPVTQGDQVNLYAHVVPGSNPTSSGYTVTVDVSATGDVSPIKTMLDGGVAPDATAGDLVFTYQLNTEGMAPGRYSFPLAVTDAQGRRNSGTLILSIAEGITDPFFVSISSAPNPVPVGSDVTIRANVALGTAPDADIASVTVNAEPIGLSDAETLQGIDDLTFEGTFTIDPGTVVGPVTLVLSLIDLEDRQATGQVTIATYNAPGSGTELQAVGVVESSPVVAGDTTRVFAIVTPGTEPASTGINGACDLTAFDLGDDNDMNDAGTAGDDTPADNVLTKQFTVPADQEAGEYTIPMVIQDEQGGVVSTSVVLQVIRPFVPTDPALRLGASPNPVHQLQTVKITAAVAIGTEPDSTGLVVTADLSQFGGSATQAMVDTGIAPDATASDLIFTCQRFIGPSIAPGDYSIRVTVTDAQLRTASTSVIVTVLPKVEVPHPPIPDHPISMSYDTLTHNVARVTEGAQAKVCRYIRDGLNAPLLQAAVDTLAVRIFDEGGVSPEVALYDTGRLQADAQNADGSLIVKTAVATDGQAPSRSGYTFEFQIDAEAAGLRGDRSYRLEATFWLISPDVSFTVTIPLACDASYS